MPAPSGRSWDCLAPWGMYRWRCGRCFDSCEHVYRACISGAIFFFYAAGLSCIWGVHLWRHAAGLSRLRLPGAIGRVSSDVAKAACLLPAEAPSRGPTQANLTSNQPPASDSVPTSDPRTVAGSGCVTGCSFSGSATTDGAAAAAPSAPAKTKVRSQHRLLAPSRTRTSLDVSRLESVAGTITHTHRP